MHTQYTHTRTQIDKHTHAHAEPRLHSIMTEKERGAVILFSKGEILFCDCRIIRTAVLKKIDKMNDQHQMLCMRARCMHIICNVQFGD